MEFKCVNEIHIPMCDGNGFTTGEWGAVEVGSRWFQDNDSNIIGGEVHLEAINSNDFGWIEITYEELKRNFEVIEKAI